MIETRARSKAIDRQEQDDVYQAMVASAALAGLPKPRKPRAKKNAAATKLSKRRTQSNAEKVSSAIRITKSPAKPAQQNRTQEQKLVRLALRYKHISRGWLKKFGITPPKAPKGYFPYPSKPGMKLGHNYWDFVGWAGPSEQQVREVHDLLKEYHATFQSKRYISKPAHGPEYEQAKSSRPAATIDMLLQTIFAQTTGNENAIDTHSRLCNRFVYTVNGRKVAGKMPDWHKIRVLPREQLEIVLLQGGLNKQRARYIQETLNAVYDINSRRRKDGKFNCDHDGNPPNALDFVPGMLSLDYLTGSDEGTGVSDEEMLGRLVKLSGIGIKSAMCLMAFGFHRPLFVVDTHVLRMTKWLGWVPESAKEDVAAMFLHSVIPENIRYDLHQLFWVHCANENVRESKDRVTLCPFCGATPPARTRDVSKYKCPIAHLLPPFSQRWSKRYEPPPETKAEENKDGDAMKLDDGRYVMKVEKKRLTTEQATVKSFFKVTDKSVLPTPPPTPESSRASSPKPLSIGYVATDGSRSNNSSQTSKDVKASTPKTPKPKTYRFGKSVKFDLDTADDDVDALLEQGYLCFEFRPLDDNFMEDRGHNDVKPRYRFEQPGVMDADVAVDPELARAVMRGERTHKWSCVMPAQLATAQMTSAVRTMERDTRGRSQLTIESVLDASESNNGHQIASAGEENTVEVVSKPVSVETQTRSGVDYGFGSTLEETTN